MKIVFINDRIYAYATGAPSAAGGAERQQWLLARALAARGWSVSVGLRGPLQEGAHILIDGVKFCGIGQGQILASWSRFFASEQPDFWYWRCASHLFGFGVALAKLNGIRSVFAAGFDRDVKVREALYERPRWWPAYAIGLSAADRIVVQHGGQFAELPRRWQRKAHIVPSIALGVNTSRPHAERPQQVAWIATLRQPKRPDLLVEVARRVPHVRFVVCGDVTTFMTPPGYGERMVQLFRSTPNIDYRGQVSPEEALLITAESALLLSTADEEGFPNTFLEAWTHGTPVVSLTIDPDRVISLRGLGAVCPNVDQAATMVAELLRHPESRDAMAHRACDHVASAHSEATAVAAFERALNGRNLNIPESGEPAPQSSVSADSFR